MDNFLPFAFSDICEDEIDEVVNTLRSGWITTGPKVARFEKEFAQYIGAKYALAVNSATAGLHLSLEAINVGHKDLVITTPYTFAATAEAISYAGADPVFVDINRETFNIDCDLLKARIETMNPDERSRLKAIMPVHFGGQACDMPEIIDIAKKYQLKVVEDAAHALPSTINGKLIGTMGDTTVFSFYATKTLTTGEGGMVTTDSDEIAKRIKVMRIHGIDRDIWERNSTKKPEWHYEVIAPGFKYNMSDIMAAIGIHQLEKLERLQIFRNKIAQRYNEAFSGLPLRIPVLKWPKDKHSWYLYVIQLEIEHLSISRDEFIEKMLEKGIGTSVHFIPLHLFSYWRDRYGFKPDDFPVALDCFKRVVSLPIYSRMTDADVEKVINSVKEIMHEYEH